MKNILIDLLEVIFIYLCMFALLAIYSSPIWLGIGIGYWMWG